MRKYRLVVVGVVWVCLIVVSCSSVFAQGMRVGVPLKDGNVMPGFFFLPRHAVQAPIPGVVVGVGVISQLIPQYHDHCRALADRNFAVLLIDPSNYPEQFFPGPFSWDKGMGYVKGSINQGLVAAKLAVSHEWYLDGLQAALDFLCRSPMVDRGKLAVSGFSQPANAALTYANRDPRVRAIVWNYGGSPWVMPYDAKRLPPVQIFHGTADDVYDVKYAKQLAHELRTNGRMYDLNLYPNEKHMFNVYFDMTRGETRYSRPVIQHSFEKLVHFLNTVLNIRYL